MTTNRSKIKKFCKKNNLEILKLKFIRNRDACYGDTWDASFWILEFSFKDNIEEFATSPLGNNITDDIDFMLKDIIEYINS